MKPTLVPYVTAVVAMVLIGVTGVVTVQTVRPGDNTLIITAILGFITTTLMALLAFLKSNETHASVNGQMEEFKAALITAGLLREVAAHAEGVVQGKVSGAAAANKRTDELQK